MKQLDLTQHTVQFHSHFTPSSTLKLVSLVQLLERELTSQHRCILLSDNLLHIDNKQLRIAIENNGDIDVSWTLNVCQKNVSDI